MKPGWSTPVVLGIAQPDHGVYHGAVEVVQHEDGGPGVDSTLIAACAHDHRYARTARACAARLSRWPLYAGIIAGEVLRRNTAR